MHGLDGNAMVDHYNIDNTMQSWLFQLPSREEDLINTTTIHFRDPLNPKVAS